MIERHALLLRQAVESHRERRRCLGVGRTRPGATRDSTREPREPPSRSPHQDATRSGEQEGGEPTSGLVHSGYLRVVLASTAVQEAVRCRLPWSALVRCGPPESPGVAWKRCARCPLSFELVATLLASHTRSVASVAGPDREGGPDAPSGEHGGESVYVTRRIFERRQGGPKCPFCSGALYTTSRTFIHLHTTPHVVLCGVWTPIGSCREVGC